MWEIIEVQVKSAATPRDLYEAPADQKKNMFVCVCVCEYCEKLQTVHLKETKIQILKQAITLSLVTGPLCTSHKGKGLMVIKTQGPFIIDLSSSHSFYHLSFITDMLPWML